MVGLGLSIQMPAAFANDPLAFTSRCLEHSGAELHFTSDISKKVPLVPAGTW